MKVLFLVIIGLALSTGISYAGNVPAAVKAAFELKYPGATNVSWEKESSGDYEAEFRWKGSKYSAQFTPAGDWVETSKRVDFKMLPEKVAAAFKKGYRDLKAETIYLVEKAKGATDYEIEVKKKGKVEKVYYTSDGVIITR